MCVCVCVCVCVCLSVYVCACNCVECVCVLHAILYRDKMCDMAIPCSPYHRKATRLPHGKVPVKDNSYATRTKSAPFSDLKRTAPFPLQHWQWEGLGACCCRRQMLKELCHTLPPLCIPTTGKIERKKQIMCGFV